MLALIRFSASFSAPFFPLVRGVIFRHFKDFSMEKRLWCTQRSASFKAKEGELNFLLSLNGKWSIRDYDCVDFWCQKLRF